MELKLTLCAQTDPVAQKWKTEIAASLKGVAKVDILESFEQAEDSHIFFFDNELEGLEKALGRADRTRQALILVVREGSKNSESIPDLIREGKADGVILVPFRKMELLGCIRLYEQVVMWHQVGELNQSMTLTLRNLSEDLQLAERLQKARLPKRFPDVKNFQVMSRYFAGVASGGDYFDLAEAKDGKSFSILLSNTSSYGLSNTVLAILMKVTLKLSQEEDAGISPRPGQVLKRIYEELLLVLGDKDELSIFYGTINRSNLRFRYVHLGKSSAYFAQPEKPFLALPKQGGPICKSDPAVEMNENEVELTPESRLVLVSSGFDDACGGASKVQHILQSFRRREMKDTLNELAYTAKSNIDPEQGMPNRDCSAIIFDVESRSLRSIKPEPDEN